MIFIFTMKLQFILQCFTVCLQFFVTAFCSVFLVVVENYYSFYNKISPPRARVIFFYSSFFSSSLYLINIVKAVKSIKKRDWDGVIRFFKNCKVIVKHCKVTVNQTVKGGN